MIEPLSKNIQDDFFCSQISRQIGEQLIATATIAKNWLLLEYPFPWEGKAFEESNLPSNVKDFLSTILATIPQTRLQMIKKQNTKVTEGNDFFVGVSQELQPRIYEFHLNAYEDMLTIDIPALFSGDEIYQSFLRPDPLYLVCTNGKRDQCCAKFGFLTYTTMASYVGNSVWQSSHIGGHRFAPNVLCFPHGLSYGRVTDRKVETIIQTYGKGKLYLENYRGRTCYDKSIQAAEYFLYQQGQTRDLDAYSFHKMQDISKNEWQVEFLGSNGSDMYRLQILKQPTNLSIRESCSATDEKIVSQYKLIQYQIIS